MPVTLTEEDRQQAHKEALGNRPPECRCAVEIYIVYNGTNWAISRYNTTSKAAQSTPNHCVPASKRGNPHLKGE